MTRPEEGSGGWTARLDALDGASLAPIAAAALAAPEAEVSEWSWEGLRSSIGPATGLLVRVYGTARVPAATGKATSQKWSAIFKVLRPPQGHRAACSQHPSHWTYWRREAHAYESGLLPRADVDQSGNGGGLTSPRLLGFTPVPAPSEGEAESAWLWLEELSDSHGAWWPRERTLLAARHVGALSGTHVGGVAARPQWLAVGALRDRVEEAVPALKVLDEGLVLSSGPLNDLFGTPTRRQMLRVWNKRGALLHALDSVPQTLVHGDCHRGNLMALPTQRESGPARVEADCTGAVDWGAMGSGPVGADLAEFVLSRSVAGELRGPGGASFGADVFQAYVEGKGDAGWRGDQAIAYLGFASAAALIGTVRLTRLLARAESGARDGGVRGASDVLQRWAMLAPFFLERADEALSDVGA